MFQRHQIEANFYTIKVNIEFTETYFTKAKFGHYPHMNIYHKTA